MEGKRLAGNQPIADERLPAGRERRQLRDEAETRGADGSIRSLALGFFGFLVVVYAAIGYGLYLAFTALF